MLLYSFIFEKASANALLIGSCASFCCFFKYLFTSFLLIPEPCFSFLCLNADSFSLYPQTHTNFCPSPSPTISIFLWHTGHLAFVTFEIVFLYPQIILCKIFRLFYLLLCRYNMFALNHLKHIIQKCSC